MQNMKAKYGIIDENTYNFDKSGFIIDIFSTSVIVTSSEQRNWAK